MKVFFMDLKKHFETLATAADNPNFDKKYHYMNIYKISIWKAQGVPQ